MRWAANSVRSFFSTSGVIDPALGLMIKSFEAFGLSSLRVPGRGLRRPAEYLFPDVVARGLATLKRGCPAGASILRTRRNEGRARRTPARPQPAAGVRTA